MNAEMRSYNLFNLLKKHLKKYFAFLIVDKRLQGICELFTNKMGKNIIKMMRAYAKLFQQGAMTKTVQIVRRGMATHTAKRNNSAGQFCISSH